MTGSARTRYILAALALPLLAVKGTIGELLRLTDLDKVATEETGPRGMRAIYEAHRGDFHVEGFEGNTKKDHVDHIKGMSETLLPYLRERWSQARD